MYLHWLIDIFWEMVSSVCWKIHFGVYSAYLLCNGNNSCCLCLAFTVRFIHKHQLPMVLEDSTAENPLYLFVVIILQTLYKYTVCLNILGSGIISLLENSLWCIQCTFTTYAVATTLVACVLLSLLCESTACLVILENDIIILLKIHFGVQSADLLCYGNNTCCLCLTVSSKQYHRT